MVTNFWWAWLLILISSKTFHAIVSPTYTTPCLLSENTKTWMGSWVSMEECKQPQHCMWEVVEDGKHHQQLVWWKVARNFENQDWKNLEPYDGNRTSKITTKGMQLQMWLIHKTCGKVHKKASKTRKMPPIELAHSLKCKENIFTFPRSGNEDHLVGCKRKEV
jgi:hypothetical protein